MSVYENNDEFELYISSDWVIVIQNLIIEAKDVRKLIESLCIYLEFYKSKNEYIDLKNFYLKLKDDSIKYQFDWKEFQKINNQNR